ncbi:hypothetical protein C8R44DRAFT_740129 [Mycena epipterygia]|nr:hypothetical protein C8R44DRAFT_740129 [Mycena epipterygia]
MLSRMFLPPGCMDFDSIEPFLLVSDEIWRRIADFFLPEVHNHPGTFARMRGILASICRGSYHRIYNDPHFWSALNLNLLVAPQSIAFALAHCPVGPLRVRLALIDYALVDDLFRAISHTAHRWNSFFVYTEHPGAYIRIRSNCADLHTPLLSSLSLRYGYMPGYSEFDDDDDIYDAPFTPLPWFNGSFEHLKHLELSAVGFPWITPNIFATITSLDLTDYIDNIPVDWAFYDLLFSTARCLRYLRIDSFPKCRIPPSTSLYAPSLAVLDVGFDGDRFLLDLLSTLIAPGLVDLTVRDIHRGLHRLLRCHTLLRQLVRFALYGDVYASHSILYDQDLVRLFNFMPQLQVLDLRHARREVFFAYALWAYRNFRACSAHSSKLRALYVGRIELRILLEFLVFHGANDAADGSQMVLRTVRVKSVDVPKIALWLKQHIVDYDIWTYTLPPVSLLRGPMYGSDSPEFDRVNYTDQINTVFTPVMSSLYGR